MKGKVGLPRNYFVLNTGDKIPAIGLGTWRSGGDLCVQAVKTALSVGYPHIDCAHLYGNEVEVGEALAGAFKGSLKREDVERNRRSRERDEDEICSLDLLGAKGPRFGRKPKPHLAERARHLAVMRLIGRLALS
ncbi:aldo/keto reductase slr0942-like [Rosa chinensis]|uniref:aldo/keto reductase slr0942-like n=1 Tax=Rosa chinensis TaxID=74649 RepID=UPI000D097CEA|nr:aldo/keto reductase slr0942-like [Rosa chinensis]